MMKPLITKNTSTPRLPTSQSSLSPATEVVWKYTTPSAAMTLSRCRLYSMTTSAPLVAWTPGVAHGSPDDQHDTRARSTSTREVPSVGSALDRKSVVEGKSV